MDASTIGELVNTVGFPVAAFCLMFYMVNSTLKELQTTVNKNTEVIVRLEEKLDREVYREVSDSR